MHVDRNFQSYQNWRRQWYSNKISIKYLIVSSNFFCASGHKISSFISWMFLNWIKYFIFNAYIHQKWCLFYFVSTIYVFTHNMFRYSNSRAPHRACHIDSQLYDLHPPICHSHTNHRRYTLPRSGQTLRLEALVY